MGWVAIIIFAAAVGVLSIVLIRRGRCEACELLSEKCRLRQAARQADDENADTPAPKE